MTSSGELIDILMRLTRTLAVEQSLDACLDAITRTALELAPCDHASVRILDASRTELLSGARSGEGILADPMTFRPGWGVAGWVVEHGRPALIPDTSQDERFVDLSSQGFVIGSMMAVPLFSVSQVIGVLAITARDKGAFDESHFGLAKLLANVAIPRIEGARMRRLAITDHPSLALRPNVLEPKLVDELRRAHPEMMPLSVLHVLLDGFAGVDHKHGHEAADVFLRVVAGRLRSLCRTEDILFRGRGGGFVLLMPGAATQLALDVAERIRRDLAAESLPLGEKRQRFQTASLGLVSWDGEEGAQALLGRAEAAATEAHRAGGNIVRTGGDPGNARATQGPLSDDEDEPTQRQPR